MIVVATIYATQVRNVLTNPKHDYIPLYCIIIYIYYIISYYIMLYYIIVYSILLYYILLYSTISKIWLAGPGAKQQNRTEPACSLAGQLWASGHRVASSSKSEGLLGLFGSILPAWYNPPYSPNSKLEPETLTSWQHL